MSSHRRLTGLVYVQQFVSECIVIYPLYVLMFSQRSGLSTAEISILLGWWLFVILASELPTGILADRFSKKAILFLSNIFKAAAFGIWLFLPSFLGYALGFLIWGIGCALNSGAFQAYLYEELRAKNATKQFTKLYTRSQSLALIGMVTAYLVAAGIGSNYSLLLEISIAISLVSALLTLSLPSPVAPTRQSISQINLLKGGAKEIRQSPIILRIAITLAVVAAISQVGQEYTPLYYNMIGIPENYIPILLAIGLGFSALLAWLAHRFEHKAIFFQLTISAIAGILLLATSFSGAIIAMIGMLVFMRLSRLSVLLHESNLQHNITGQYRATIGSIPMFVGEALSIVIIVAYGSVAYFFGDTASIRMLAVATIVGTILLFLYWRNHSVPSRFPEAHTMLVIEEQPASNRP